MKKENHIENEEEVLEEDLEENEKDEDVEDEDIEDNISDLEKELEEVNSRFLRLQADFVNYKKRVEKEKDGLINYGMETIVCELLPILDNFERAMGSEADKDSSFYSGIEMIQEQLIEVLKNNDVKEIEALHEPFDHNYHHAVVMEDSEDWEEGIVLGILQKGYVLKDKVIRPAMVMVSK